MRWREGDISVQQKRNGKAESGASIGPQKLAERSYRPQRKESESFSESCLRMNEANRKKIFELALLFLKLGTIAFGGPAAHIAMMEEEVVKRRGWLDHQQFLDLLGATNLIPGPNSTEMAIHIGLVRAGWKGLIVAGSCFILPAMLIVWALAWLYVEYGSVPEAAWLLYGIKPVILAIVIQALWSLGKSAFKGTLTASAGAAVMFLFFLGLNEIVLLFAAGFAVMGLENLRRQWKPGKLIAFELPTLWISSASVASSSATAVTVAMPVGLVKLTFFFLKIGSVLFCSGYVLLTFLRAHLVERWHWLTDQQLLDAIAIGQFTPGPVFTTATFIGYLLAGSPGAILATVGIFLPPLSLSWQVALGSPGCAALPGPPL